jgi:hypothetical protein
MDELIARTFEPLLKKFIVNFKREQLNLSFMKVNNRLHKCFLALLAGRRFE